MPVFDRNEDFPGRKPNWWLDYYVSAELVARFELKSMRVREPGGLGSNKRAAERLLALREREVKDGAWKPSSLREGERLTVEQWAPRWRAIREAEAATSPSKTAMQNVHDQWKRIETYVLPAIGSRPLCEVKRDEIKQLVASLTIAGKLAPRTIHHVYDATRSMFAYAVSAEPPLLERSPCNLTVKKRELPKKRDKNPGWRSQATFTHGELVQLFTDERNPIDRRTLYALTFFCGNRFGEAAGRRIRDYDRDARPLGRIVCATQYDDKPLKGEAPPRDIPVHPFLAHLLDQWLSWGFELVMGRSPRPDDWLVPSRRGRVRSLKHTENRLAEDLDRIGLRRRTPHALRAAFISLAQQDGGERSVLEVITHKGNADVWAGYTRHPWAVLCDHVARLKLAPPSGPRSHSRSHSGDAALQLIGTTTLTRRDGRDLKPLPPPGTGRNGEESGGTAIGAYAAILGVPGPEAQTVTPRVAVDLAEDLRRSADVIRSGRVDQLDGEARERLAAAGEAAAEVIGADAAAEARRARERVS